MQMIVLQKIICITICNIFHNIYYNIQCEATIIDNISARCITMILSAYTLFFGS